MSLTVLPTQPSADVRSAPSPSAPGAQPPQSVSQNRAGPSHGDTFVLADSQAAQRVKSTAHVRSDVQLSAAALKQLDDLVNKATTKSPAVAVTVLALDKNRPIALYQAARGVAGLGDQGATLPANASRLCRVASISKSVTGLLLTAMLKKHGVSLEARLLDFDIPFVRHLKSAIANGTLKNPKAWESVTLHELCNHTSGIAYDYLDTELVAKEGRGITDAEMDALVLKKDFFSGPSGTFNYSNVNYNILARVVGALSKEGAGSETADFQKLASNALFGPLGLDDQATFNVPRDATFLRDRVTHGFDRSRKTTPVLHEANVYAGSAGLSISIEGLRKYLDGMLGLLGGTKSAAGLEQQDFMQMLNPHATFNIGLGTMAYARGMYWQSIDGKMSFGHLGIDDNHTAVFAVYPETGIAVAVTTNSGGTSGRWLPDFVRKIGDAAHGVVAKDINARVDYVIPPELKTLADKAKSLISAVEA